MADLPPGDGVPTWVTAIVSILSTLGVSRGVGPAARWAGKRLDLIQQGQANELSTCRQEIKALRAEFREYQDRADGLILSLSVELAGVKVMLKEREDDVADLRAQLQLRRSRQRRTPEGPTP